MSLPEERDRRLRHGGHIPGLRQAGKNAVDLASDLRCGQRTGGDDHEAVPHQDVPSPSLDVGFGDARENRWIGGQ